jgi:hypothetical protein
MIIHTKIYQLEEIILVYRGSLQNYNILISPAAEININHHMDDHKGNKCTLAQILNNNPPTF